jgi:hypothetical protein
MGQGEPHMAYWLATLAVLVLSYVTGFSIGLFLLPVGLAMLVLGPFRHRPPIYWPPMAALLAFLAGYLAVAPLSCWATSDAGGTSTSGCSSLIGITYPAPNPPVLPGIFAGSVLAATTALVVASIIWWRERVRRTSAV